MKLYELTPAEYQLAEAKRILEGRTYYTFDELSKPAKEHALDHYQVCDEWDTYLLDDYRSALEEIGFIDPKIYYSGFSSQGDGASFIGTYAYAKGRAHWFSDQWSDTSPYQKILNRLVAVQKRYFYGLTVTITTGSLATHYSHENTVDIDVWHSRESEVPEHVQSEVREIMRDFMRQMYQGLGEEYMYAQTDGAIDDMRSNDTKFNADGSDWEDPD
jgi:hypothetical protein